MGRFGGAFDLGRFLYMEYIRPCEARPGSPKSKTRSDAHYHGWEGGRRPRRDAAPPPSRGVSDLKTRYAIGVRKKVSFGNRNRPSHMGYRVDEVTLPWTFGIPPFEKAALQIQCRTSQILAKSGSPAEAQWYLGRGPARLLGAAPDPPSRPIPETGIIDIAAATEIGREAPSQRGRRMRSSPRVRLGAWARGLARRRKARFGGPRATTPPGRVFRRLSLPPGRRQIPGRNAGPAPPGKHFDVVPAFRAARTRVPAAETRVPRRRISADSPGLPILAVFWDVCTPY